MQELCLRPPVPLLTLSVEKQSIIPTRLPKDMLLFYSAAERDLTHSQTTELSTAAWEQRRNYCSAECRWDALGSRRVPLAFSKSASLGLYEWHGTWHFCVCVFERYFANEPFADLHRVEGLRGVFVATLINGSVTEDNMRSVITFDKGGTWELLQPPEADSLGGTIDCQVLGMLVILATFVLDKSAKYSGVRRISLFCGFLFF